MNDARPKDPGSALQPTSPRPEGRVVQPLRVWLVWLALALMGATRLLPRVVEDGPVYLWIVAAIGPAVASVLLLLWWLFASRATPKERLLGTLGVVLAFLATVALSHPTVVGPVMIAITLPLGFAAFGLAVVGVARRQRGRAAVAVLAAALGFGATTLWRSEGARGDFTFELRCCRPDPEPVRAASRCAARPAPGRRRRSGPRAFSSPSTTSSCTPATPSGFDGSRFTCIDLASGARAWKEGHYGKGQVLLVVASGHLLVTAETGEVVLLAADPGDHRELARFQALEGKTWNHPVLIGDRLYVRNSQEAACYRLPLAGDGKWNDLDE